MVATYRPIPSLLTTVFAADAPLDALDSATPSDALLTCLVRLQAAGAEYAEQLARTGMSRAEVLRRVHVLVGVGMHAEGETDLGVAAALSELLVGGLGLPPRHPVSPA